MKTKISAFFILLLLFGFSTFSQSAPSEPVLSVPFKYDGRILIPIEFKKSKTMDIILDSGFPQDNFVLLMHKELGEELELEYFQSQKIGRGAGSGENKLIHLAADIDVALSHIDLGKKIVGVMDESRGVAPHHNKGVLGGVIFVSYVVKIDFDRSVLELYLPETFRAEEGWEVIPILLSDRNIPMIEASFSLDGEEHFIGKFLFDTGGGGNIIILDEEKGIKAPAETLYTLSGTGLRGDVFSDMGRLSSLKIGKLELKNLLSAIVPKEKVADTLPVLQDLGCRGLLGSEALSQFNMIIDYAHNKLYLKPNNSYGAPFELNMAGMLVKENPFGDFIVYHVLENREASKKGLIKGDKISRINGKPISDLTYPEIKGAFEKDGETVRVEILRNGKTIKLELKLERLI